MRVRFSSMCVLAVLAAFLILAVGFAQGGGRHFSLETHCKKQAFVKPQILTASTRDSGPHRKAVFAARYLPLPDGCDGILIRRARVLFQQRNSGTQWQRTEGAQWNTEKEGDGGFLLRGVTRAQRIAGEAPRFRVKLQNEWQLRDDAGSYSRRLRYFPLGGARG